MIKKLAEDSRPGFADRIGLLPSVKPYLDRLVAAAPLPKRDQEAARTALASTLPKLMPARKEVRPIQLASARTRRWQQGTSVVIDYQLLSSASGFTFQGDTTYYVSGTVNLTGTTTIEGGAVVKFTNDSSAIINVSGPVYLQDRELPSSGLHRQG